MLNHVLVPLDESELSEKALDYALAITAPNGKITLISAILPPVVHMVNAGSMMLPMSYDDGSLYDTMVEQARVYLEDKCANLSRHIGHVDLRVMNGEAAESILEVAEELKVDAIVMSTHGRSGITRWVFGSVTQKVLNAANCPVLVIPSRAIQEKSS